MKKLNWLLIPAMAFSIAACDLLNEIDDPINVTIELSGAVSSPMVLEDHLDDGYDYYVTGEWSLDADVTIMPGVSIMMKPESSIRVNTDGSLNAIGTEVKPIVIEGEINTKGAWGEIEFDNSNNPKNVLDYVMISDGGGESYSQAMIDIGGNSQVKITNCVIENSGEYGIQLINNYSVLREFSNNIVTGCEGYHMYIYVNQLHVINATNVFYDNGDFNYVMVEDGNIDKNVTWEKLTAPVLLSGPYNLISADVTVAPGAEFVMGSGALLTIEPEGSLNMTGTVNERITFTSKVEAPGYFEGITFEDSNNPLNQLHYVDISYGGGGYSESNLWVRGSSRITIGNCSFNHSSNYGIYVSRDATLTDDGANTFTGNALDDIYVQQ
ncbi:MAG: right-handed parallel beta-helix repeat-containing protein [Bacteroidales bacterium]|nr:right-handed parallel beta-helix repeat-containing protein [Bacteroidales bacterium]MDT8430728.1 right-handed parallel beta-helix repeat-containing protein [Bacteroidales bacterium]